MVRCPYEDKSKDRESEKGKLKRHAPLDVNGLGSYLSGKIKCGEPHGEGSCAGGRAGKTRI